MIREDVIRQILQRESQGEALEEAVVQKDAIELYQFACSHFGTWMTALTYAGVPTLRSKRFTRDEVIRKIRRICRRGYDLRTTRVLARDRKLYESARFHFGTWRKALTATGIHLQNAVARKGRKLDRKTIIQELLKRSESGLSLEQSIVGLENRNLCMAIRTTFRSWNRALIAAGLEPDWVPPDDWTPERVVECLRKRHAVGKSTVGARIQNEDRALYNAVRRHFGRWYLALQAAGLEAE